MSRTVALKHRAGQSQKCFASATREFAPKRHQIPTLSEKPVKKVEIIIYTICLCIGGPLNIISFYKILRNMKQTGAAARSSAQITLLRLHLNIADLITMFVYTTSQIIWMITFQWYGGDLLCRLCKFFHTFNFYLNSFVVACIAIDRVFGTYNLSTLKVSQRSYIRCKHMLTVAWLLAFLFSIPQPFVFKLFSPPGMANFKQCTPLWTVMLNEIDVQSKARQLSTVEFQQLVEEVHRVQLWERIYNIVHLLFVFWIPALVIVASYVTVLCLLNNFEPSKKAPRWKHSLIEWLFGEWSIRKNSPTNSSIHAPSATPRPSMVDCAMSNHQQPLLVSIRPDQSPVMPAINKKCRGMSYGNVKDPLFCVNENGRSMSATSLKIDFTPRRSSAAQRNIGPFALQTINRARQVAKRQATMIIIAYFFFWLPYNLMAVLLMVADDGNPFKEYVYSTLPFLNSLLVLNGLLNPLIFGVFNRT